MSIDDAPWLANVDESAGSVSVYVSREHYFEGAVSVTVSPVAGTAIAGEDYSGTPVTLSWADGESGQKLVSFTVRNDAVEEDPEQFSVRLSAPTGGAILGRRSTTTFTILDNDQPSPPPPRTRRRHHRQRRHRHHRRPPRRRHRLARHPRRNHRAVAGAATGCCCGLLLLGLARRQARSAMVSLPGQVAQ